VPACVYVDKYGHSYVQLLMSRQDVKVEACKLDRYRPN